MLCAYWALSKSPKYPLCPSCITQGCYCLNRVFLLAELSYFHLNFSSKLRPVWFFFADPEPAGGWKQIPGIQGYLWNNISDRIWPCGRVWLATFPIQIMGGRAFPNSSCVLSRFYTIPIISRVQKGESWNCWGWKKPLRPWSPTVHVCSVGTWWG